LLFTKVKNYSFTSKVRGSFTTDNRMFVKSKIDSGNPSPTPPRRREAILESIPLLSKQVTGSGEWGAGSWAAKRLRLR
jgi:hypothetical protein